MSRTSVLYVRVPREMHDEMERLAAERNVSLTAFVQRACQVYLASKFGIGDPEEIGLP